MTEMDSKDPAIVTQSGSRSKCILRFTRDYNITHILTYISGTVRLKSSDCNPRVCLLKPVDSTGAVVSAFSAAAVPQAPSHTNKAPSGSASGTPGWLSRRRRS
jgi:hypothetical protein